LLVMIEVHVFNSLIIPSMKSQQWFSILNFINGLVAPSFLFISGFAFAISANNKLDELRTFGKAFRKKTGRILMILILGYLLHFPVKSVFVEQLKWSSINWLPFFRVDILQCIAAGLFLLFAAMLIIRKDKFYDIFVLVTGLVFIFLSPFIYSINFTEYVHPFFAYYFNNKGLSLFPVFPWLGFLFMGAVACKYFLEARLNGNEKKYIYSLIGISILFLLTGYFLPLKYISESFTDIYPDPVFFILRLGFILLLLVICWYYELIRKPVKSFVTDVGKESLLVYWLHLIVIYGVLWNNKSLYSFVNQRFGILECALMTFAIAFLMVMVARLWSEIKLRRKLKAGNN